MCRGARSSARPSGSSGTTVNPATAPVGSANGLEWGARLQYIQAKGAARGDGRVVLRCCAQLDDGGGSDPLRMQLETPLVRLQVGRDEDRTCGRGRRRSARAIAPLPTPASRPGRSLLRNTAGCSMTPVANTTARARILVMRAAPPAPPNDRRSSRRRRSREERDAAAIPARPPRMSVRASAPSPVSRRAESLIDKATCAPACGRRERRRQTARAAADHQHVAKSIAFGRRRRAASRVTAP